MLYVDKTEFCDALLKAGLPVGGVRSDRTIIWDADPTVEQLEEAERIRGTIKTLDYVQGERMEPDSA